MAFIRRFFACLGLTIVLAVLGLQRFDTRLPTAAKNTSTLRTNTASDTATTSGYTTRTAFVTEDISIDQNSALARDIEWIRHNASESTITVLLRSNRTCQKPVFIGRLSGPSLHIVEWAAPLDNNDRLVGQYSAPVTGEHFVEIIAEYCESLDWHSNFTKICVENPFRHRITMPMAKIRIIRVGKGKDSTVGHGSWMRKPLANTSQEPVYTRVQPPQCMRGKRPDMTTEPCRTLQSTDRFSPYHFEWNEVTKQALSTERWKHLPRNAVCFYGASHARYLTVFTQQYLESNGIEHISTMYLFAKTAARLTTMNLGACQKVIIGVGQWDAGWPWHRPTLFGSYHQQMESMVRSISNYSTSEIHPIEFYLRSMHYIPLGYKTTSCPPTDWRMPSVVSQYNSISRTLGTKYNIPYLDTNIIIGAVWDSAYDWCHYKAGFSATATRIEVEYLLAKIFGLL